MVRNCCSRKRIVATMPPTEAGDALSRATTRPWRGRDRLCYNQAELPEMHSIYRTSDTPMKDLEFDKLSPGSAALAKLQGRMR